MINDKRSRHSLSYSAGHSFHSLPWREINAEGGPEMHDNPSAATAFLRKCCDTHLDITLPTFDDPSLSCWISISLLRTTSRLLSLLTALKYSVGECPESKWTAKNQLHDSLISHSCVQLLLASLEMWGKYFQLKLRNNTRILCVLFITFLLIHLAKIYTSKLKIAEFTYLNGI